MHSAEEQVEHESVEGLDENQLRRELIDARREIADLKDENSKLRESPTIELADETLATRSPETK